MLRDTSTLWPRQFKAGEMNMSILMDQLAFDRGVEPVFRILTQDQARQILAYRADPELQQKIEVLAAKSNEGELTDEERAEYEGYVRANKFVAIMQAKARQLVE
jgi:hypothetical protein